MKIAVACALLALVPLSTLRMVCVDADAPSAPVRQAATDDSATRSDDDECARICARRPRPAADAPAPAPPAVECLLVPDGACQFLAGAGVAIMPREPQLPVPHRAVRLDLPAAGYLAPSLSRRSPPPRIAV